MKTISVDLTMNKLELDFSEDSKNPLSPCKHCGTPTRGRESISSNGRSRRVRNRPACLGCSMKAAFSNAFAQQGGA